MKRKPWLWPVLLLIAVVSVALARLPLPELNHTGSYLMVISLLVLLLVLARMRRRKKK